MPFGERTKLRCKGVVTGALALLPFAASTEGAALTKTSSMLSMNSWMLVISASILAIMTVVAITFFLKRRSPPALSDAPSPAPTRVLPHQDSAVGPRAWKEEISATSGILGGLLDQYLSSRFWHLLLIYPDPPALQKRLREVEGEYAAISFFYFCKLLALLAECEREGGAMPLLSTQVARDNAQRLMNRFLSSIPQGEGEGSLDTFAIAAKFREHRSEVNKAEKDEGRPCSQVADFVRRVHPKKYASEGMPEKILAEEFPAYEKWLMRAPPDLIQGAEALRAFYMLTSKDLHGIGQPPSQALSSRASKSLEVSVRRTLSAELTPLGVEAISSESPYPRPIGLYIRRAALRESMPLTGETSRKGERKAPTEEKYEVKASPKQIEPSMQSEPQSEPVYTLRQLEALRDEGFFGPLTVQYIKHEEYAPRDS